MHDCARLLVAIATAAVAACNATPLPTPPTVYPEKMTLVEVAVGQTLLIGGPGAAEPAGLLLRVTSPGSSWTEQHVRADGSFIASFASQPTELVLYIEAVSTDRGDQFLVAVTRALPTGGDAVVAVDVPDSDMDGSPDLIDCSPTDPMFGARTCPPLDAVVYCVPRPEACNGEDENCNGTPDDACMGACADELDCPADNFCIAGACTP